MYSQFRDAAMRILSPLDTANLALSINTNEPIVLAAIHARVITLPPPGLDPGLFFLFIICFFSHQSYIHLSWFHLSKESDSST